MRELDLCEIAHVSGGENVSEVIVTAGRGNGGATVRFTKPVTIDYNASYGMVGGIAKKLGAPPEGEYIVKLPKDATIEGPDKDNNGRPDVVDKRGEGACT